MANLVEVAKELEYVPEQQLAQMINDPNSRFPNFLVISEVQRRTLNDRAYQAALNEMPQTTVAQEKVAELMQPKGLAGMGAPESGLAPTTDAFSSAQPMPASTRMMSDGGKTKGLRDHMKDIVKGDYTVEDKLANYLMRGSNIPFIEDIQSKRGTFRYSNPDLLGKNSEFSINYNPREGYGGLQFLKRFKEGGSVNDRIGFQNGGYTSIPDRTALARSFNIDTTGMNLQQIQAALADQGVPRGLRNNNPLNIRYNPNNDWIGQIGEDEEGFSIFGSTEDGMRAGDILLNTYGRDYGIDTLSGLTERFAPASDDNDPVSYANYLSDAMGIKADETIDLSNPAIRQQLTPLIARLESPIPDEARGETASMSDANRAAYQDASDENLRLRRQVAQHLGSQTDPNKMVASKDSYIDRLKSSPSAVREGVTDFFMDDDGTVDWSNVANLGIGALSVHPVFRGLRYLGVGAKGLAQRYAPNLLEQGRNLGLRAYRSMFTRPGVNPRATEIVDRARRQAVLRGAPSTGTNLPVPIGMNPPTNVFSVGQTLQTLGYPALAYTGLRGLSNAFLDDDDGVGGDGSTLSSSQTQGGGGGIESGSDVDKKIDSYMDQVSGLDMAKLGGIIMSARNTSELGEGLAGLASDMQTRLTEKEARENTQALQEIQAGLAKAQTDKIKNEIEQMPATRLNQLLERYGAYQKGVNEGMIEASAEDMAEFNRQYMLLLQRATELQGIDLGDLNNNIYNLTGATVE